MISPLLSADEPAPVGLINPDGSSPFVILCDHGGKIIPRQLRQLGLPQHEIDRHIGWDIGALAVSEILSQRLDAPLVHQRYSRLVIDCNRQPGVPSSIPTLSESTTIPGNEGLSDADRDARRTEIFEPYHQTIRDLLAARRARGLDTCILAMHSFTPVFFGQQRPWEIGVLYHQAAPYARAVLARLEQRQRWVVGDNQPYSVSEETDYAVPQHADKNGLPYVEIELRQDLIAQPEGQQAWAEDLLSVFADAWQDFNASTYRKEA